MNTDISYTKTIDDANTIQGCATTMQTIFEDFGKSMQIVLTQGLYEGEAHTEFDAKFNSLKARFDDYVATVTNFSNMILGATQDTQITENKLAQETENFKG